MGIVITSVQVPFVRGGGEILAENLRSQLIARGYRADIVTAPFRYSPVGEIENAMNWWAAQDLSSYCASRVDRVIHLKFPCYYASHPSPVLWLLHQHRPYYELWETSFGPGKTASAADARLREKVLELDTEKLARIPRRYTIANNVSERLRRYNGVESSPIYHPPVGAERLYCGESLPYVFAPSRLEPLKRHKLLIEALALCHSPIVAIIAGEGGYESELRRTAEKLGVSDRVRFVGRVTDNEMRAYYANARAVFFGPFDEDYGYVTLEAMLSKKPVITCTDSGGPLEFVQDGITGAVCSPEAESLAAALDSYGDSAARAIQHGQRGYEAYGQMNISWDRVIETLLA